MQNLMTWEGWIVWILAAAVVPGMSAYFGSYLRKSGENRATKEALDDLVVQVRAVTAATKEIEARISGEVWERQRRWELKRDLLIETTRRLAGAADGLKVLSAARQAERSSRERGNVFDPQMVAGAMEKCGAALVEFEASALLVGLVCGGELDEALDKLRGKCTQIAGALAGGQCDALVASQEFWNLYYSAFRAIRKELHAGG